MYHIVKDVAILIEMSFENHCLTCFPDGSHISKHEGATLLNSANWHVLHLQRTECRWFRTSTISDLVISDAYQWFRTVISDGVQWSRTVISDGVRWIRTPRWIRTVISDGVRWIRTPNLVVFFITLLVLISLISDSDLGQWFRTVISDGVMHKKP